MIGDKELARTIGNVDYGRRAPKGWKKVGEGSSRTAYLGPDGLVYKVLHNKYNPYDDSNTSEISQARKLRKRAKYLVQWDIAIPEVSAYRVGGSTVNVMPYLPSEKKVACPSWHYVYGKGGYVYEVDRCTCRVYGEPRCCFGLVYKVLESEFGLVDMWIPNLSFNSGFTWPIDLGEYDE